MTPAGEQILAHHAALLAIPAFVPAVVVVGVVLYIARKDRKDEREERDLIERAFEKEDE
jgi:thioredoxin-related protein